MRPDQITMALAVSPQPYYVCSRPAWGREREKKEEKKKKKKREKEKNKQTKKGCDLSCPSRVFVSGRVAIGPLAPVCLPLSQSRHALRTAGW